MYPVPLVKLSCVCDEPLVPDATRANLFAKPVGAGLAVVVVLQPPPPVAELLPCDTPAVFVSRVVSKSTVLRLAEV